MSLCSFSLFTVTFLSRPYLPSTKPLDECFKYSSVLFNPFDHFNWITFDCAFILMAGFPIAPAPSSFQDYDPRQQVVELTDGTVIYLVTPLWVRLLIPRGKRGRLIGLEIQQLTRWVTDYLTRTSLVYLSVYELLRTRYIKWIIEKRPSLHRIKQAIRARACLSRTGYVIFYANCPIIWQSKLQTTIALSTTEAKYVVNTHCERSP